MTKASEVLNKLEEGKDPELTIDEVTRRIKPVFTKMTKANTSDEEFEAALDSYGEFADVVDKYFSSSRLSAVADKIHYNQNLDKSLNKFLKSLK